MAQKYPAGNVPSTLRRIAPLVERAAQITGIPIDEIKSRSRKKHCVHVRMAIILIARQRIARATYPWLADQLGMDNHTSALYMMKKADRLYSEGGEFRAFANKLAEPWNMRASNKATAARVRHDQIKRSVRLGQSPADLAGMFMLSEGRIERIAACGE